MKCQRIAIIASRQLIMELFSPLWLDLCVYGLLVLFPAFQRINTFNYDRFMAKLAHEIAAVMKHQHFAIIASHQLESKAGTGFTLSRNSSLHGSFFTRCIFRLSMHHCSLLEGMSGEQRQR